MKGKVTLTDEENSWERSFVIDKRAADNRMAANHWVSKIDSNGEKPELWGENRKRD